MRSDFVVRNSSLVFVLFVWVMFWSGEVSMVIDCEEVLGEF